MLAWRLVPQTEINSGRLALVPITTAAYIGLPRSAIPSATTGVRIFQHIGGALGTAILAVILQHAISAAGSPHVLGHAFPLAPRWPAGRRGRDPAGCGWFVQERAGDPDRDPVRGR